MSPICTLNAALEKRHYVSNWERCDGCLCFFFTAVCKMLCFKLNAFFKKKGEVQSFCQKKINAETLSLELRIFVCLQIFLNRFPIPGINPMITTYVNDSVSFQLRIHLMISLDYVITLMLNHVKIYLLSNLRSQLKDLKMKWLRKLQRNIKLTR